MRIYVMTDLEGVCGVLSAEDWCQPGDRYYDRARALLTQEVNAAVEGFLAAGAAEIVVADGHGCGAVDGDALHAAASLMRGWPMAYPLLLDERPYDAVVWIGQHPKAGTVGGHLCHTGTFAVRDSSINGVSVGEFGEVALCAGELGIRSIFASGCEAFTREAEALVPGIETAAVKRGTQTTPGHALPARAYGRHNTAAVHLPVAEARRRIREGAQRAVERAARESFGLVEMKPPYERVTVCRSDETNPPRFARTRHTSSVSGVLNMPLHFEPMQGADPLQLL